MTSLFDPLDGYLTGRRQVRPLSRLTPFLTAYWADATWSLGFLVLSTAATLSLSGAARLVIDRGFAEPAKLNRTFLLLTAAAAILALATAGRYYFITKLGERVVADLRTAVYRHALTLDQSYFLRVSTGDALSRLTTDITIVETVVGGTASVALRNLLILTGALILLIWVSPGLTLLVALLAPVVLAPLIVFGRRVRRLSAQAQDRFAHAVAYAGETLDGLETLQAFGRERTAADRFGAAVENAFAASLARIRARTLMTGLVIALVFGGVAAIFWLGAHAVARGAMTGGALLQFAILAVLAAGAAGSLGEAWGDIQKAAGAMERIVRLLDAEPVIVAPSQPHPLPSPPRGELAFEGVVFAYPGREAVRVLNRFDLTLGRGERVALVGPSGCGKTTVLRLALRFYDPQEGTVRLDGIDVRAADPADVRARFALVGQDAPLFSGSAMENLAVGSERASPERLRSLARAAHAEAFIEALPGGFEAPLGERGRTLSGGQRQRLAIARALARDAPILLLDEATSALDAENESAVQRALQEAMTGRTTLVIAHRLATVLAADRIVVMEAGRVVDVGRHAELLARGGLYGRLAELQFRGQVA